MNIIVLGAGAIGSFYGARLSRLNEVLLIGRKKHVDEINKNGLKVGGFEDNVYFPKAAEKIKKIKENTLIILSTKVYDTEKSLMAIRKLLRKDIVILCLQNGFGIEKIAKKAVKNKCRVIRAVTKYGVIFEDPGFVKHMSKGYTIIEDGPFSEEIAEIFSRCGLNASVSKNLKEDMWKKLILNCTLNPLAAIYKVENRKIANKKFNPVKKLIIEECLKAAEKDGVKFDFDFLEYVNGLLKTSRNKSSMQQDLLKGNKTEVDYLNGAIVDICQKNGISCPA